MTLAGSLKDFNVFYPLFFTAKDTKISQRTVVRQPFVPFAVKKYKKRLSVCQAKPAKTSAVPTLSHCADESGNCKLFR
jgi:hypothetical protein